MDVYRQRRPAASPSIGIGGAEFDILKSTHRFLRDDDDHHQQRSLTWDDRLAKKYYDHLYREFAVCDLKHYKSGNFALRWRTETEVLSGIGEETCGNTRCPHHSEGPEPTPALTTLELPFAYSEHGEHKSALVKVVLCARCCKKLMWKHRKDKEREQEKSNQQHDGEGQAARASPVERSREPEEEGIEERRTGEGLSPAIMPHDKERPRETRNHDRPRTGTSRLDHRRERERETKAGHGRTRSSRSRSPTSRHDVHERRSHRRSRP